MLALTSPTYRAAVIMCGHSWLWNGSLELTSFFANCRKSMVRFTKRQKKKNLSIVYLGYWGEEQTVVVVIVAIVTG